MFPREAVGRAATADPPEIRGLFVPGRMAYLIGYVGSGSDRLFWFDGMEAPLSLRDLIRKSEDVAFASCDWLPRLQIDWRRRFVPCPACGTTLQPGGAFWVHYNREHARVPFWLNESDWRSVLLGSFESPFRLSDSAVKT